MATTVPCQPFAGAGGQPLCSLVKAINRQKWHQVRVTHNGDGPSTQANASTFDELTCAARRLCCGGGGGVGWANSCQWAQQIPVELARRACEPTASPTLSCRQPGNTLYQVGTSLQMLVKYEAACGCLTSTWKPGHVKNKSRHFNKIPVRDCSSCVVGNSLTKCSRFCAFKIACSPSAFVRCVLLLRRCL